MNRLVTLLITLPFVGAVLVMLGLLPTIIQDPQWDSIIPFVIMGSIAVYLMRLLLRTAPIEGGIVELPVSPEMAEASRPFRKRMMTMVLLVVYGLAGILVIALVGFGSLQYWIGGFGFILGIHFLISAWLAARSLPQSPSTSEDRAAQVALLDQSLTAIRKSRNYVLVSYPLIALYLTWTYQASHGEGSFSLFDLIGVLFVLASSALWFVTRVQALRKRGYGKSVAQAPEK